MVGLSVGEKHFIQGGIAQDLCSKGQKRLTYRPIQVETGVIPQANGSARVKMGATDVIGSVKDRGGEELSTELSATLQRCLLGGKSGAGAGIDLSSLSIVEGKVCWDLYIDCLVVSSDGNLLDALGAAIKAEMKGQKAEGDEEQEGKKFNTCEECGASFRKPAHLKQHMQSHSLEIDRFRGKL